MADIFDGLSKLVDVVFNGRPAVQAETAEKPAPVTIQELIARKSSTVKLGDRRYRVVVTEITETKEKVGKA